MTQTQSNIDTTTSKVSFQIKKLGLLTVKGTFEGLEGVIAFDENDLQNSTINVSASSKTVNTGNSKRDEHLINEDFFNVSAFPKISFQSSSIKKEKGMYIAVGKLSMLKETKEISIPFTFENDVFDGSFSLNRKDYNLGSKFPGFFIGNSVQIAAEVKVNK